MKGNRPSSLPVARFCSRSPALSSGAGRAAAMSSVWHARAAGKDWRDAYDRLTEEEQGDIDSWKYPEPFQLPSGHVLKYETAEKEVECGVTDTCGFALKSDPEALTAGHCDFYWKVGRVLYVGDLKKSQWTCADGPRSLQVVCYALALAAKHGDDVDGFVCGIWHAEDGFWSWGDYVSLDSEECMRLWNDVRVAASNVDGDYATGPHCRSCYARQRCPAYLVPPEHAHDGIAKYFSGELTNDRALELLRFVERVEDTCKSARSILKASADINGITDPESGKVYKAVMCKGKMGLDKKSLEQDHPELVQKYMVSGKPYPQHRWVNGEKK